MKNSMSQSMQLHPMFTFWLGLLTGALIVGLVFFYRVLNPSDYESAVLKKLNLIKSTTTQVAPTTLNAYPVGGGNYAAYPVGGGN